jgi:MoxR-like ATPase
MKSPYYSGQGMKNTRRVSALPISHRLDLIKPENYIADPGLVDAANVAIILGQPLLLTGEAGTGKTQFAYSLAWELELGTPLKFETKSTSIARDLFYTYDALKRFQDIQSRLRPENALPYIAFQALGIAVLRTRRSWNITGKEINLDDVPKSEEPIRSVVLIDEVDKAPRDFPNDILNEIENMYFRIPEMGNIIIEADNNLPPIVVITSNSEKDLPDAFLRRCAYYNIPFPDKERLQNIISNRLGAYVRGTDKFIDYAIDLFYELRNIPGGLRKPPSIAEMLGWMITLRDMAPDDKNPLAHTDLALRTLSSLIKTTTDQEKARDVVQRWLKR